jgi:thiol-disulfide isomerase/thioredoxin
MRPPPALRAARPLAAALLFAAACCAPAQAFHLTDLEGKTHELGALHGRWVVLNVWATWCAPCIHEMPELEALARARPDVLVLGLAADGENRVRVRQFAKSLHVSYPIVAGTPAMLAALKVRAYPTTMVFDPAGTLVLTKMGQLTRRDLEPHLQPLAAH